MFLHCSRFPSPLSPLRSPSDNSAEDFSRVGRVSVLELSPFQSSWLRPQLNGYLKHASPQQCAAVARAATPPPTPPPAPPVPTPPLPSPHEHPPRRLAATHAVAALTPLPTALQLASKDAAYSLDSPANVSRLRLRLAHGMVRWYLTTAAACGVSHPFCAVSHHAVAQHSLRSK